MPLVQTPAISQAALSQGLQALSAQAGTLPTLGSVPDLASLAGAAFDDPTVRSAMASATSALTATAGDLAGNVSSAIGTVFGDTTNRLAATFKTPVADAVTASFAKQPPQAATFLTNSMRAQVDTIDFGRFSTLAATELGKADIGAVGAMAAKLGAALPLTDKGLADLKTLAGQSQKEGMLAGLFSGLDNGLIAPVSRDSPADPTASLKLADITSKAASLFGGLGRDWSSQISGFINTALPATATAGGLPIAGVASTLLPGVANTLGAVGQKYGLTDLLPGTRTNYCTDQNIYNAGFGVAVQHGVVSAVQQMGAHGRTNGSTRRIAAQLLPTVLYNPEMTKALVDVIGPENVPAARTVINTLVRRTASGRRQPGSAVDDVVAVVNSLGYSGQSVFGTGRTTGGQIIWNTPRIQSADPGVSDALIGADVRRLTTGTAVGLDVNGAVVPAYAR